MNNNNFDKLDWSFHSKYHLITVHGDMLAIVNFGLKENEKQTAPHYAVIDAESRQDLGIKLGVQYDGGMQYLAAEVARTFNIEFFENLDSLRRLYQAAQESPTEDSPGNARAFQLSHESLVQKAIESNPKLEALYHLYGAITGDQVQRHQAGKFGERHLGGRTLAAAIFETSTARHNVHMNISYCAKWSQVIDVSEIVGGKSTMLNFEVYHRYLERSAQVASVYVLSKQPDNVDAFGSRTTHVLELVTDIDSDDLEILRPEQFFDPAWQSPIKTQLLEKINQLQFKEQPCKKESPSKTASA